MTREEQYHKTLRGILDLAREGATELAEDKNIIGPNEFSFMIGVLGQALGMVSILGVQDTDNKGTPQEHEEALKILYEGFQKDALYVLRKQPPKNPSGKIINLFSKGSR